MIPNYKTHLRWKAKTKEQKRNKFDPAKFNLLRIHVCFAKKKSEICDLYYADKMYWCEKIEFVYNFKIPRFMKILEEIIAS